jgi:hypothetical protein
VLRKERVIYVSGEKEKGKEKKREYVSKGRIYIKGYVSKEEDMYKRGR